MLDLDSISLLLEWCANNSVSIDPRLRIDFDEHGGLGVFSTEDVIPQDATLVRITKDSVLSTRSCSLADHIPPVPYGLGAQIALSMALYGEILKGSSSRWYGYLQALPTEVDIPLFWDHQTASTRSPEDGLQALTWLTGTEVDKVLHQKAENEITVLEELIQYYQDVGEPLLLRNSGIWKGFSSGSVTPTVEGFLRAYSLVSSRAFLVDAYHGLSMVPIADAFNHVHENHVHLESDFNVCPECGSLSECAHDRDGVPADLVNNNASENDSFYEMVSNIPIPPHSEVFNTYGDTLTNAQLLTRYGFTLDANENDNLTWTIDEVSEDCKQLGELLQIINDNYTVNQLREIFCQSQLIYNTPPGLFLGINGDGRVSDKLWILLGLLSSDRGTSAGPTALLRRLIDLQLLVESQTQFSDDMLLKMARSIVSLCGARKRNGGVPGSECQNLGDVLDALPPAQSRTRTAVAIVMSERSILDSCEAAWRDVLTAVQRQHVG